MVHALFVRTPRYAQRQLSASRTRSRAKCEDREKKASVSRRHTPLCRVLLPRKRVMRARWCLSHVDDVCSVQARLRYYEDVAQAVLPARVRARSVHTVLPAAAVCAKAVCGYACVCRRHEPRDARPLNEGPRLHASVIVTGRQV